MLQTALPDAQRTINPVAHTLGRFEPCWTWNPNHKTLQVCLQDSFLGPAEAIGIAYRHQHTGHPSSPIICFCTLNPVALTVQPQPQTLVCRCLQDGALSPAEAIEIAYHYLHPQPFCVHAAYFKP
jgi:hypothetical protein